MGPTLFLVMPTGSVARETLNGFESKWECAEYATRYRQIEHRWRVEFVCELASGGAEGTHDGRPLAWGFR